MTNAASSSEVARLEEAAEWLQTLSSSPEDSVVEAWLEWCARDPRNQQAFDGMAEVWNASGDLPLRRRAGGSDAAESRSSSPPRKRGTLHLALAASIAVVICSSAAWIALRGATEDQRQALVSPIGVNSTSQLPDGSIVELGGRTSARLAYSMAARQVEVLDGEVYLTVAKDSERPFVVSAGPVRATAIGTAFNVRRSEARVTVTVGEGIVEVAPSSSASNVSCATSEACVRLAAGQQLLYVDSSRSFVVTSVDPAIAASWRTGMLKFVDEPLGAVLASVNRYSHRPIELREGALGQLSFTGTVHVDRIDRWLEALENAFPLTVVDSGDQGVVLVARR